MTNLSDMLEQLHVNLTSSTHNEVIDALNTIHSWVQEAKQQTTACSGKLASRLGLT